MQHIFFLSLLNTFASSRQWSPRRKGLNLNGYSGSFGNWFPLLAHPSTFREIYISQHRTPYTPLPSFLSCCCTWPSSTLCLPSDVFPVVFVRPSAYCCRDTAAEKPPRGASLLSGTTAEDPLRGKGSFNLRGSLCTGSQWRLPIQSTILDFTIELNHD